MELKEVYKKIDNLLDIQERRCLTSKEKSTLISLKRWRNHMLVKTKSIVDIRDEKIESILK